MTDERIARTRFIDRRHFERRQPDPFVAASVQHAVRAERDDDVLVWTFAREPFQRAVRVGLERVKRLPAATGKAGTTMGFGDWDHGALKGEALVLRAWRGGRTVEVG